MVSRIESIRATSSQQVAARSSFSLYICYCRSVTPQYGETQISLTAALVVSLVRSGRGLLLIKTEQNRGFDDNEKGSRTHHVIFIITIHVDIMQQQETQ